MRRFEILWLHSCGKFAPEISKIVQQNVCTVREVINKFRQGGIEIITTIDSNHPKSDLESHRASILEEFQNHPPVTAQRSRCTD
jgi:transposase